jgi:hypothetical protein
MRPFITISVLFCSFFFLAKMGKPNVSGLKQEAPRFSTFVFPLPCNLFEFQHFRQISSKKFSISQNNLITTLNPKP